jgi:hypothetical protein
MGAEVGLHASQVGLQKCAQLDECIVASACRYLVVADLGDCARIGAREGVR